jgi:hypothetical protein
LFGHSPNLGADRIQILWRLRHNTGNFGEYRPPPQLLRPVTAQNQSLAAEFPQRDREFSNVLQGNFLDKQGNYGFSARAGNVCFRG